METIALLEPERIAQRDLGRWKMSRAGILNFWYYDDEEFCLEDGKIILRGTNGSGKSVTMQSFIPLVLDGDKRPERLDPFGSRDRRLEYYLLGDMEQGHTDRTGYLWLEFYHAPKNLYKTIGIGLRARKNVKQLGFWGFLLEDGRRINYDFWLYDRNLWLEQNQKVPLNRKLLEEKISSGGKLVQEQSLYRDMVNKSLFGFQDQEGYKDLLKLLLELRSPKLSKDFKPTAMYNILTNALPPLLEEELRPLTDIMEDMEQIADRLEELEHQRKNLSKIQEKYEVYNRFILNQHSAQFVTIFYLCDQLSVQVRELEAQNMATNQERAAVMQEWNLSKQKLVTVETELDILNRSEAIEKQKELELVEEQLCDTKKQLNSVKERILINSNRFEQIKVEISLSKEKLGQIVTDEKQTITEMEDLARMIEFRQHDIYHGMWSKNLPEDERWAGSWKKDLDEHKKQLTVAFVTARAERELSRAAADAAIRLGEVNQERNHIEDEKIALESKSEEVKERLRENVVIWQQALKQLPMNNDLLRESLRSISNLSLKNRNYKVVQIPALTAFEQKKEEIMQQMLKLDQQKGILETEQSQLLHELRTWELNREPEPRRTEGRHTSRQGREPGTGAPFYAVCDFNLSLSEFEKAELEETLEQAGLLDAWIYPGGLIEDTNLTHKDEEVWIQPKPVQGKTLASVISPAPSIESGLSIEDINKVLSSFSWTNKDQPEQSKSYQLSGVGAGHFKIGPLVGQKFFKKQAEYIGKEARLLAKRREMERLESEIRRIKLDIISLVEEQGVFHSNLNLLKKEMESFPNDQELQDHFELLVQVSYRLEEIMSQEQKVEEWYKEKNSSWRSMHLQLIEQTANWSLLKQEKTIEVAIELCGTYLGLISELNSLWIRHHDILSQQITQEDQQNEINLLVQEDYEQKQEMEEKNTRNLARSQQLGKLMVELGIEDIHLQITALNDERETLKNTIEDLFSSRETLSATIAGIEANLAVSKSQLNEKQTEFDELYANWKFEFGLALLPEWHKYANQIESQKDILQLCQKITKTYSSLLPNKSLEKVVSDLVDEFNLAQVNLHEYVLEREHIFSNRILITSKRDRMKPITPTMLLEELTEQEQEQRFLLTEKDRLLYEEIILQSVGKAIRYRIHRAKEWVHQMNELMGQRDTSSGLKLSLKWTAKARNSESELDTETLVELLMRDSHRMDDSEIEQVISHFRSGIFKAKEHAEEKQGSFRQYIYDLMDYRSWFEFKLLYRKGNQTAYKELTDSKFNVLSGGEKAMAMYIPLFAATYSRYNDARADSPKIISLDEAFAGVDDANMRDMFHLLTDMGFDYMMTSQVLWGCYDTVPQLAIYEIYRPKDSDVVTLFHYRWNGETRTLIEKNMNTP